ncbi:MAG: hypothetical protein OEV66_09740, partial [Spirochaetia bacterium]|nr:hypothetical protein [Spirochaetia bacterium]
MNKIAIFKNSLIFILLTLFMGHCSNGCGLRVDPGIPAGYDTVAPTVPGSFSALVAGSAQINLSWTTSTDNLVSPANPITYEICQSTVIGSCANNFTATYTTAPDALSYNVTGLLASTTYYFTLRASDASGNKSAYSNEISATTTASTATGVTVSVGSPSATIANNLTIETYTVTYTGASTINLTPAAITLSTTGTATCTIGVTNGTTAIPTVTLTNCTGDGTVGITVAANTATDAAG